MRLLYFNLNGAWMLISTLYSPHSFQNYVHVCVCLCGVLSNSARNHLSHFLFSIFYISVQCNVAEPRWLIYYHYYHDSFLVQKQIFSFMDILNSTALIILNLHKNMVKLKESLTVVCASGVT